MIRQLRRQRVRTLTTLLGVLVAATGFTLLTGAVETSRLQVTGTVDKNYRSAYDVLVRPGGSRTGQEAARGQVRPNFLSGQYGGITLEQWRSIGALPGVEAAAPVAMVGYTPVTAAAELDLTERLDPAERAQLFQIKLTWQSDQGLSTITDPGMRLVYVTRNPVLWPEYTTTESMDIEFAGYRHQGRLIQAKPDKCGEFQEEGKPPAEVLPGGQVKVICAASVAFELGKTGLTPEDRSRLQIFQALLDGGYVTQPGQPTDDPVRQDTLTVRIPWAMPLLLAAIDPVQEARLVGLDKAVVSGRYLHPLEAPAPVGTRIVRVPFMVSASAQIDQRLTADVVRLDGPPSLTEWPLKGLGERVAALPGETLTTVRFEAEEAYRTTSARPISGPRDSWVDLNRILRSGQPRYLAGEVLSPQPVSLDAGQLWRQDFGWRVDDSSPLSVLDVALRPVTRRELFGPGGVGQAPFPEVVGHFDPARLTGGTGLASVPLETYRPAAATGTDAAARKALGDEPLLPDGNPGAYLATPPQLLTTLRSLPHLIRADDETRQAPISAVRVRVAGVTGLDDLSQERVRDVAERIATTTGLDVDITIGSSPGPRTVRLPAGSFGRPELNLREDWTTKGVAVALIKAVDRKSVLLSVLILAVCVLFLSNTVAASVRVRRRELAVLGCLGWPAWRLSTLVLGEVLIIGLAAGALGVAAAFPLAALTGITLSGPHALLAVPVACGVTLLAGLVPALRAGRAHPMAAIHPAVLKVGRARRRRTVYGMAVGNVIRVPGRSLAGVVALAVGVAAVGILIVITRQFHGTAQGTLLGDAVSLQVRGVDLAAALTTVALGVFAIADALYLSVRERAAELAALRACGWSDLELSRLIVTEGGLLGFTGAAIGTALALGGLWSFTGGLSVAMVTAVLPVTAAGAGLAVLAAAVPAQLMRGLRLAAVLAED
ncbi:hypothetical protein Aph01nite_35180 [Acrocarpospora phusangensis]|uniref:ABC3 transporter permease C-terminal domain-containing protein n=1 Tax=Acrocarpospora phusangensis TaxID=1070424 RepID=A0A919QAR7_9ACTN|nr:ABC transporter permease [Acrocarpospora phusangensis]GIH25208.1 hypothetical protein Aph01nite_35180 [Acrocarpospora phusangensis]